jgi:hypothetical protein
MTVFVGNTNILDLLGLKNATTGAWINDATVTLTVKDAVGAEITGESWPQAMNYVSGSNGDYRAILEDDLEFTPKQTYYAHIRADAGVNRVGAWTFVFTPQTRAT